MSITRALIRKNRPAALLSVVVLAWISGLLLPCTTAVAAGPKAKTEEVAGGHDDCHGTHSESVIADDGCCCDMTAAVGAELLKVQKGSALFALRIGYNFLQLNLAQTVVVQEHGPPLHQTSPPVYLATQRFRI